MAVRRVWSTVVAALLLGWGLVLVISPTPASAANGIIAYIGPDNCLFVMNADGSNPHKVGNVCSLVKSPSLSPDGLTIAFTTFLRLNTIKVDGTGQKQVSSDFAISAAWSPDGTKIAYTGPTDEDGTQLITIAPDGSGRKVVTSSPALDRPTWSPDSTKLAFEASPAIFRCTDWNGPGQHRFVSVHHIFSVPATGGTPTRLVQAGGGMRYNAPDWYSNTLTYRLEDFDKDNDGKCDYDPALGGPGDIYAGSVNITNTPTVNEDDPSWSTDGSKIAYNGISVRNSDGSGSAATLAPGSDPDWLTKPGCTIEGTAGNDVLTGGPGAETICGKGGNDTLIGGGGDDLLIGDAGIDTVSYASAPGPVVVNLVTATASGDGFDTIRAVENVIGSANADTLIGDTNANRLTGGGGGDVLSGRDGNDAYVGGSGDDVVTFLQSAVGVTVNLTTGVATGQGSDTLTSVEFVNGSNFNDVMTGNGGVNRLRGLNGKDTLAGLVGNDTLDGGGGRDTVNFSAAGAAVTANLTTGTATGNGNDTLVSVEDLRGSPYNDNFKGSNVANLLAGLAGNDRLDVRDGISGDRADGGAGTADTCIIDSGDTQTGCP